MLCSLTTIIFHWTNFLTLLCVFIKQKSCQLVAKTIKANIKIRITLNETLCMH